MQMIDTASTPGPNEPPLILVVEDEILIRFDLADTLREAGYQVLEAADATEALALIKASGTISLVITDVRMPGECDGLELAREIRRNWPRMPVVIASGHWHADNEAISDRLLQKPYTTEQVLLAAQELITPAWLDGTRAFRAS